MDAHPKFDSGVETDKATWTSWGGKNNFYLYNRALVREKGQAIQAGPKMGWENKENGLGIFLLLGGRARRRFFCVYKGAWLNFLPTSRCGAPRLCSELSQVRGRRGVGRRGGLKAVSSQAAKSWGRIESLF